MSDYAITVKAELDLRTATWGELRRYVDLFHDIGDSEPVGYERDAGEEIVALSNYLTGLGALGGGK